MAEGPKWITAAEVEVEELIHRTSVTLTNDQIIALPTDAIEIIPAIGDGSLIVPISIILDTRFVDDYTVDTAAYVFVNSGLQSILQIDDANYAFFTPGGNQIWSTVGFGAFLTSPSLQVFTSSAGNNHISIAANNNGENPFSGGNAENTMRISIYYTVVDVS